MDDDGIVITPAQLDAMLNLIISAREGLRVCETYVQSLQADNIKADNITGVRDRLAEAIRCCAWHGAGWQTHHLV